MGPSLIITASPLFDHYSRFSQASKYLSIQTFLPKRAVETFATAILPRLPWLNIGQLDMLFFQLFPQARRNQLAAIVTADCSGPSIPVTASSRLDVVSVAQS